MHNNHLPACPTEKLDSFYAWMLGPLRYSEERQIFDVLRPYLLARRPQIPFVMMLKVVSRGVDKLDASHHPVDFG
jgi:hypothetical protein